MVLLKKSEIFARKCLDTRVVHVPEWGGDVLYKPMTMMERRWIRQKCIVNAPDASGEISNQIDAEKMELYAIISCVLDPEDPTNKRLMFVEDDIVALEEQMAAGPISTVSQAIMKASGLMTDNLPKSKEKAKE